MITCDSQSQRSCLKRGAHSRYWGNKSEHIPGPVKGGALVCLQVWVGTPPPKECVQWLTLWVGKAASKGLQSPPPQVPQPLTLGSEFVNLYVKPNAATLIAWDAAGRGGGAWVSEQPRGVFAVPRAGRREEQTLPCSDGCAPGHRDWEKGETPGSGV